MLFKRHQTTENLEEKLNVQFELFERKKLLSDGMAVKIEKKDGSFTWQKGSGDLEEPFSYAQTDITKMFTGALVQRLRDEKKINLDTCISRYFSRDMMEGLMFYHRIEYSQILTIRHLLANTSGLPDYFDLTEKMLPRDTIYSFNEVIARIKEEKGQFVPGTSCRLCSTNYQILGEILEKVSDLTIEELYTKYLYRPLGLKHTVLLTYDQPYPLGNIYYKKKPVVLPRMLASERASGGLVSDQDDIQRFLRGFFDGELFDQTNLTEIQQFRFMPPSFEYGMGLMKVKLGRWNVIGHSGRSGSFAYYVPHIEAYITGTINEFAEGKELLLIHKLLTAFQ